jgi:hypothetical protein
LGKKPTEASEGKSLKLAVLLTDTGSTKKSSRQNLNLLVQKPKLKKKKKGKKNVQ